jgi:hypothetical protein
MLGSLPTKTQDAQVLARIEQLAEGIAYCAPELANARRAEIITAIRREIREWRRASGGAR